jgi:hypothetical protein
MRSCGAAFAQSSHYLRAMSHGPHAAARRYPQIVALHAAREAARIACGSSRKAKSAQLAIAAGHSNRAPVAVTEMAMITCILAISPE